MDTEKTLVYDGTFNGLLTAVFNAFEQKLVRADIQRQRQLQSKLFGEVELIYTDYKKAERVKNGLRKKGKTNLKTIYSAYLSEQNNIESLVYKFIQKVMGPKDLLGTDFDEDCVMVISQITKKVHREKHRMEAFIRFQLTKDGVYFANIEPDFDVLPLISKHFENRYADQQWIIYDIKRKYGLYYDLNKVQIISLELKETHTNRMDKSAAFTDTEYEYQDLWNNYFKSTNIKSRNNMKLHVQHVPKRYWKYLSEKI